MDFNKIYDRKGTSCLKWDSDQDYISGEVLPAWVADMDFPAPDEVVRALESRASHPIYGYTYDESFQEITRDWIVRRHGWNVEKEWIEFCPSVLTSLAIFINMATMPGQHIIIMPPIYYPFFSFIENNGRHPELCPLLCKEGNYIVNIEGLKKAAEKEDTAALIMCNPHNPAGRVFTVEELEEIGSVCLDNGLRIFSDEIHSDLVCPGHIHVPIASLSEKLAQITVTAYSPSKTFNLAGIQASSVVIPDERMKNAYRHYRAAWGIDNINCFALESYKAAYRYGDSYVKELIQYLESNREYTEQYILEHLPELSFSPLEGTYLMWLECSGLSLTDEELERFFWEKAKLSLDGGIWFGESGTQHMRLNIACPRPLLKQALEQLDKAVWDWRMEKK